MKMVLNNAIFYKIYFSNKNSYNGLQELYLQLVFSAIVSFFEVI